MPDLGVIPRHLDLVEKALKPLDVDLPVALRHLLSPLRDIRVQEGSFFQLSKIVVGFLDFSLYYAPGLLNLMVKLLILNLLVKPFLYLREFDCCWLFLYDKIKKSHLKKMKSLFYLYSFSKNI